MNDHLFRKVLNTCRVFNTVVNFPDLNHTINAAIYTSYIFSVTIYCDKGLLKLYYHKNWSSQNATKNNLHQIDKLCNKTSKWLLAHPVYS